MKFGNSFLKLNYSIMAFILTFQTSQCNVRAMENDPTANNKKLWDMVKSEFKNNDKDQDGSIRMLTFPKNKASEGKFEDCRFVWSNGQEFGKGDYINPELEDHRAMKFFNMPAFLQKNDKPGELTGNLALTLILDVYMNLRSKAQEEWEKLSQIPEFIDKFEELGRRLKKTDYETEQKIRLMAKATGLDEETVRMGFLRVSVSDELIDNFSKEIKNIDKLIADINKKMPTTGGQIAKAAAATGGIQAGAMFIGAFFGPLGAVIGWLLGGVAGGFVSKKIVEDSEEEADKLSKKLENQSNRKDVKIKELFNAYRAKNRQEREYNFTMLLHKIIHFMTGEEDKVRNSNLFVMALDLRNLCDDHKLEKEKEKDGYQIIQKLNNDKRLVSQGGWCDFKYVPDLKNAPRAIEINGGKTINNLIDIFKIACKNKNVDYNKLRQYISGDVIPLALNPDITGTIEGFLKNNLPDETIVTVIMSMPNLKLKADPAVRSELLQLVKEQREALSASGKAEEEEKKEKKFLPQLPAAK